MFLFKHNPQYPFCTLPKRTVVFKRKISVKTYRVSKRTFKKSLGLLAGPHSKQRSQSTPFLKISKVVLKQLIIINAIREARWPGRCQPMCVPRTEAYEGYGYVPFRTRASIHSSGAAGALGSALCHRTRTLGGGGEFWSSQL